MDAIRKLEFIQAAAFLLMVFALACVQLWFAYIAKGKGKGKGKGWIG